MVEDLKADRTVEAPRVPIGACLRNANFGEVSTASAAGSDKLRTLKKRETTSGPMAQARGHSLNDQGVGNRVRAMQSRPLLISIAYGWLSPSA